MYSINIDELKKVVHVSANGMISKDEALKLVNDLKANFSKIKTSNYYLVIDSRDVKTSANDTIDVLKQVMEIYATAQFITKYYVVPKSVITASQNKRVDNISFLDMLTPVESYEDALSKIR